MTRYKIELIISDNFHLYANNEAEAKAQALDRIKSGAFPFDDKHLLRFSDFTIQSIERA